MSKKRKTPQFLDWEQYGELAKFIEEEWEIILKEEVPKAVIAKRAGLKLGFPVKTANITKVCAKKDWTWPQTRGLGLRHYHQSSTNKKVQMIARLFRSYIAARGTERVLSDVESNLLEDLCGKVEEDSNERSD